MIADAEYSELDRAAMRKIQKELRAAERHTTVLGIVLTIATLAFVACMAPWVVGFWEIACYLASKF